MSNEVRIGDMIYLTVPNEWLKTYHSLLYVLASVGKQIIDDCNYTCQGSGRNVFTCWNLFQSALAARALGAHKKAQFFIDYIEAQLKLYAHRDRIVIPDFSENYPICIYKINDDGSYTFYITCKVNGVVYNREITIPQNSYLYGATYTSNVANLDIATLTNSNTPLVGQEFTIETTYENKYIWFVSGTPLSFVQAELPLTLTENVINGIYYYHTDALVPGDDNIFIVNAG